MEKMSVSVVISDGGEGEVLANAPLFQGVYATGNSEEEALKKIKEKIEEFLRTEYSAHEHPPEEVTETVAVEVDGKVLKYTAFFFSLGMGYKVLIPLLPGCVAKGKTFQTAFNDIKQALNFFAGIPTTKKLFIEENVKKIEVDY